MVAIPLGPRARKVLRYGGVVLAAFITFVFALQLSLPLDRAKGKIIETLAPSYDVTIGSIEHGIIPGRIYLNAVTLRTRPTAPSGMPVAPEAGGSAPVQEQVTTFYIERLRV